MAPVTLAARTRPARPIVPAGHRSYDDLGTPLHRVTFVIVDLETTGGSPAACEITELGAVKYRGGECLGTFQTLVNPGVPIPPFITVLTGISDAMLLPAPPIHEALPALLEFIGGAVLVGHNLHFDTAFLDTALIRHGYPRLANRRVDTLGLARRLVRDDVENHKLATLARHFGTTVEPSHRALDDAAATGEVLHGLIEHATAFGVLGLDDLLELPKTRVHPSTAKLALTGSLPRGPGVYLFRDRSGALLYVGQATNLRATARAYFRGGSVVPQLLREVASIDHVPCPHPLEGAVRALRLVRSHRPHHNRPVKPLVYVTLTHRERFPRVTVVRTPPTDGSVCIGPLPTTAWAHRVKEAIEEAFPLRRCATRIGAGAPVCCPCGGSLDPDAYRAVVQRAAAGIARGGRGVVGTLERRLQDLVDAGRDQDASRAHDRLTALRAAFDRMQRLDTLRRAGRIRVVLREGSVVIDAGRLVLDDAHTCDPHPPTDASADLDDSGEVLLVARWLERISSHRAARVEHVTGEWSSPLPRRTGYTVGSRGRIRRR